MFNLKKSTHKPSCLFMHLVVSALLLLVAIAAFIGVYKAHVLADGLTFGTTSGSLAIIAFVVAFLAFMKSMKACMGKCESCK